MEQTISETVSIHTMDIAKTNRIYTTYNEYAEYQLEFYRTKEHPKTTICALSKNTNKFSFNVGDVVDVIEKENLSNALYLTNVIRNKFLSDLNTRQK